MINMLESLLVLVLTVTVAGPVEAGWDPRKTAPEASSAGHSTKVQRVIDDFLRKDPSLKSFLDSAYGYAVFPGIGKGGIGLGGAYGKGEVYEQGEYIGRTSVTQVTFGFQLGGQKYSEIIFFRNVDALNRFTSGNFEFSAQASAVAVTAGASANADYEEDVAVFTMIRGGLMYEASIGGQKFSFSRR